MTFEQMKESLKTIKLLEKDLLRDLTTEEKEVVINEGWEKFLFAPEHLGLTEEDYKELKYIKKIVGAFFTEDESVYEQAIKDAPEGVYFVLRDILDKMEGMDLCECPDACKAVKKEEVKKDPVEDYMKFIEDLYDSLPKKETPWFNKLTEAIHENLFKVYKENRNEQQNCSDDILGGIITDAVKDNVVKSMVEKLKNGETVEMTNDEYLEVADYLCQHEKHIFLSNENGKVRLTVF